MDTPWAAETSTEGVSRIGVKRDTLEHAYLIIELYTVAIPVEMCRFNLRCKLRDWSL